MFMFFSTESLEPTNNLHAWFIWHGAVYDATNGQWVWRTNGRPVTFTNWLTTANVTSIGAFGDWYWPFNELENPETEYMSLLSATHGAGWLNILTSDPQRVLCEYEITY